MEGTHSLFENGIKMEDLEFFAINTGAVKLDGKFHFTPEALMNFLMSFQCVTKSNLRDKCEVCYGERGGVPGNENIIAGKIMCDFCSADRLRK